MRSRVLGGAVFAALIATAGQVQADDTAQAAAPTATTEVPMATPPVAPTPQQAAAAVPPDGAGMAPDGAMMQPLPERPTAPPASPEETEHWQRAHFSAGRWVVEMIGGAAIGTLAAYGTYSALGEGTGGAFGGIAAGFIVTPLVEWGIGRAMGGQGKLSTTYLGGLIGFTASTPATQGGETLVLVIAQIMCPITSGLFFEFSSNVRARDWQMAHGVAITLAPVGKNRLEGAALMGGLSW